MIRDGIYYALAFTAGGALVSWLAGPRPAMLLFALGAFCGWFFRDPERLVPVGPVAVSPADGRVMQVVQEGDRQTRIRTQVEKRGRSCERWLPLWRSLVVNQGESPELRQRVVGLRERLVGRLELMYAPELSTLSDSERRHLLIVLEALVDVESWARMQEFFGLSFDEACAAWTQAIDRLLPPTPLAA